MRVGAQYGVEASCDLSPRSSPRRLGRRSRTRWRGRHRAHNSPNHSSSWPGLTRPSTSTVIPGREQLCERTRNPSSRSRPRISVVWIPGPRPRGTRPGMTWCKHLRCAGSDSIVRQPLSFTHPFAHTQSLSRHARVAFFSFTPRNMRGMERREAQMWCLAAGIRLRGEWFSGSASPHGAPLRRFWARGPHFRVRTGAARPDPAGFPRLHPVLVQPRTAEPRSWPGR